MYTTIALLALLAVAQARFGQEQVPIPAIAAVQGGSPGQAQTIAGAAVSDLLAGSNACAKLSRADQIITELGIGADAVAAAIGMVTAEKNFNPFAQSIPTICSDPTLPATEILRGITPLIDPAVVGAVVANNLSAKTAKTPLVAVGMSVADLLTANGFTNFTGQAAAGGAAVSSAAISTATSLPIAVISSAAATTTTAAVDVCPATVTVTSTILTQAASSVATASAIASSTVASSNAAASATTAASTGGVQASTIAGVDFGLCVPTMKFEGGLDGRPATEFTFLPIDPLCAQGQEEALNPNIITNRICDQLTNVCESNAAAKALCQTAKAQILALGTRDKTTADTWNSLLGFAGAVTNPDSGPDSPPATATPTAVRIKRFHA